MAQSTWGFLFLPLELRQQIYEEVFETDSTPDILCLNRQVHDESIQFLRERQRTFSFEISGEKAGFDNFSQRCFKIKGHTPELSEMRHLILNIHPPGPNRGDQMWHIWNHLENFCDSLALHRRILQLTVRFVENDRAGWATDGVPHASVDLSYGNVCFCDHDVGQILTTIGYRVDNVEKARLVFSGSYNIARQETDRFEQLMTGRLEDEDVAMDYEFLEMHMEGMFQ